MSFKYSVVMISVLLVLDSGISVNAGALDIVQNIGTITSVGAKTSIAVLKKVPDLIPTPGEILNFGKQAIAGLPFEVAAEAINQACSLAVAANATRPDTTPSISQLNYLLMDGSNKTLIPIVHAEQLVTNPLFDKNKKTVILITGWASNVNGSNSAIDVIYDAYRSRGDSNFVVIDTAEYVDTLYTWSAFNTFEIGKGVAKGLVNLVPLYSEDSIHIIGHSLGAHIAGSAGIHFQHLTGKMIPRITGLDPANPCFNEGEQLSGLSRGDATFVDIIHTNSRVLGKRAPIGDVDFYPNGAASLQPGCFSVVCAHSRAWELYAETVHVGAEQNFPAVKCNSLTALKLGLCSQAKVVYMGYAVDPKTKGNFFLQTDTNTPFGLFSKGIFSKGTET